MARSLALFASLLGAGVGVGYLVTRKHEGAGAPTPPRWVPPLRTPVNWPATASHVASGAGSGSGTIAGMYTPTLESWRNYFMAYGPDVPNPVAMTWLRIESGGNPCGVGKQPAPGAQPQEYGLAQLNGQDPTNLAIATPQSLRAMCGNGPTFADYQKVLRPLTEAEKIAHVVAALRLMRHCADTADAHLGLAKGARGVGSGWSPADFWRLAKTYHASSAVANLFPQIRAKLGRTPTWFEYKDGANAIALAHGFGQNYLDTVWSNAERTGAALDAPHAAGV